jgi:hypothetical protein
MTSDSKTNIHAPTANPPQPPSDDLLAPWRSAVVRPVWRQPAHTLHSYFNACPESPDGSKVVLFCSRQPDGHVGQVVMIDRAGGEAAVLADDVAVEDAHRQAYQQWSCGGRYVVFLNVVGETWQVERIDVQSLDRVVLIEGRLLAWGQPRHSVVPLYGPHWDPGHYRDIELLDVETGQVTTAVTADEVCSLLPDYIAEHFPRKVSRTATPGVTPGVAPGVTPGVSLFFPVLSPDGRRVIFKLASATGAGFRDPRASARHGLAAWDLPSARLLSFRHGWGHPAWHADSRTLINVPNILIDAETGEQRPIPGLPKFPGSHPTLNADVRLMASDTYLTDFGGVKGQWGVAVADVTGGQYHILHRADVVGNGTTSWRPPHPHPAFSADGRRLYFNVNEGPWTTLHVAECA